MKPDPAFRIYLVRLAHPPSLPETGFFRITKPFSRPDYGEPPSYGLELYRADSDSTNPLPTPKYFGEPPPEKRRGV